jgi:hypothetical protein
LRSRAKRNGQFGLADPKFAVGFALAFLGVELLFDTVTVALDRFGDRKRDELTNFWRQVFR